MRLPPTSAAITSAAAASAAAVAIAAAETACLGWLGDKLLGVREDLLAVWPEVLSTGPVLSAGPPAAPVLLVLGRCWELSSGGVTASSTYTETSISSNMHDDGPEPDT